MSCPIRADIGPNCSQVLLMIYYTFVITITSITGVSQVTASVSVSECTTRGVFSWRLRGILNKVGLSPLPGLCEVLPVLSLSVSSHHSHGSHIPAHQTSNIITIINNKLKLKPGADQ